MARACGRAAFPCNWPRHRPCRAARAPSTRARRDEAPGCARLPTTPSNGARTVAKSRSRLPCGRARSAMVVRTRARPRRAGRATLRDCLRGCGRRRRQSRPHWCGRGRRAPGRDVAASRTSVDERLRRARIRKRRARWSARRRRIAHAPGDGGSLRLRLRGDAGDGRRLRVDAARAASTAMR